MFNLLVQCKCNTIFRVIQIYNSFCTVINRFQSYTSVWRQIKIEIAEVPFSYLNETPGYGIR